LRSSVSVVLVGEVALSVAVSHRRRHHQRGDRDVHRHLFAADETNVDGHAAGRQAAGGCARVETGGPAIGQHQHAAAAVCRNEVACSVEGRREVARFAVDRRVEA
jgi:hypothetical protein